MTAEHGFEKIVGGTPEQQEAAHQELQEAFEEADERFADYEVEKTPEEVKIIQRTEAVVDEMIEQYGGRLRPMPPDHISVLKPDSVSKITDGRTSSGLYTTFGQKIGIERRESRLLFAGGLAHELFHSKSHKSAYVGGPNNDAWQYRAGLTMVDKKGPGVKASEKKIYFSELEEAVVAECVGKFYDRMSQEDAFKDEVEATQKIKEWAIAYYRSQSLPEDKILEFDRELRCINDAQERVKQVLEHSESEKARMGFAAGIIRGLTDDGKLSTAERRRERNKMYKLLDRLVAGSDGEFKNRDEVFDEFARANFSGRYLPLAKMVEGILGKGSFRKIAEEFSTEPIKKDGEASEAGE